MDALVSATAGRIGGVWLTMLGHLRDLNSVESITRRIESGHDPLTGVFDASRKLAAGFHSAYVAAGQTTARWVNVELGKSAIEKKGWAVFDAAAPPSVAWAQNNDLSLITEIDEETREVIRGVLVRGAQNGTPPAAMAREIRGSIGLTDYQNRIVDNYRRQLVQGQYAAALDRQLSHGQSDRVIAAAQRKQIPLTQAQIDTAVERYRTNMIGMRANTIARTESARVAHQGSDELYRQAIERGDLEHDRIEQEWHTSHLKNMRDSHRVMDGQKRPYGVPFTSGAGVPLLYPGDPSAPAEETANCACTKTTRLLPARAGERAAPRPEVTPDVGGPPLEIETLPAPAVQLPPSRPDPAIEVRSAVGNAKSARDRVLYETQLVNDAIDDGDFATARLHLQNATGHVAEVGAHSALARAHGDDHAGIFGASDEHLRDSKTALRLAISRIDFAESDHRDRPRPRPEPGALKATEYRLLSEGLSEELTNYQRFALQNYSNHTDKILNPMLRESQGNPDLTTKLYEGDHAPAEVHAIRELKRDPTHRADPVVGREMQDLDAAIAAHQFDRDVTVYRTMSDPNGQFLGAIEPGATFQDHGYVSTTADRNFLDDFYRGAAEDRVDLIVTLPKGSSGAPMSKMSTFASEKEVLLPRGSRFRVTKIVPARDGAPRQVHVTVEQ
jgi:hypothetical protein